MEVHLANIVHQYATVDLSTAFRLIITGMVAVNDEVIWDPEATVDLSAPARILTVAGREFDLPTQQ